MHGQIDQVFKVKRESSQISSTAAFQLWAVHKILYRFH